MFMLPRDNVKWRMGDSIPYVPTGQKVYGLSGYLYPIARVEVSLEWKPAQLTGERVHLVNVWRSANKGYITQREMTEREIQDFLEAHDLVRE